MTITVYKTTADSRALDKISTASVVGTAISTIDMPHDNNVLSPTFIVTSNSELYTANYVHCATYGRYYFIDSVTTLTGGRMALKCSVDVLQTYATAIKNCNGTIIRAAAKGAPTMYTDNKLPVYPSKKVITSITSAETSSSFSANGGYCYVLNTIGGSN